MTRFIAFLRAINVGGHTVKMDALRRLFESLGFAKVETFIASGNVVFETASKPALSEVEANARALERQIEGRLKEALGYAVATFLRTEAELGEIADYKPFPQSKLAAAAAFNVIFLARPLDEKSRQKVMALRTDIDDFHVHGLEVYWLCKKKQSESTFSNTVLEKILGRPSTIRGLATVQKMAAKYPPANL